MNSMRTVSKKKKSSSQVFISNLATLSIERLENKKQEAMGIIELVKSYELEAAAQSGREEGEIKKAIVGIRRMMEKGFSTSVVSERY